MRRTRAKIQFGILVIGLLSLTTACDVNGDGVIDARDFGGTVATDGSESPATAMYRLDFAATWSATTHPTDFPANPHFSPLIGATHTSAIEFWNGGQLATAGIEQMAETGGTTLLAGEIQDAITAGTAAALVQGTGVDSPGTVSVTFEITASFPLVTFVTMIAPSPDWFVGVHGLTLREGNGWKDEVVIQLAPYDSGTDSGTTYASGNADTDPAETIQQITGAPLLVGGNVPSLGTFTFTRIDNQ